MTKISFFWIAEYDDGTIFSQFDFNCGKENLYKDIDINRVVKIGWYPFTIELSKLIPNAIFNPILPYYVINIENQEEIFIRRRGFIIMTGKREIRKYEYILGITGKYLLTIDENGNVEVNKK